MKRRTRWIAGLAAVAVLLTATVTAFGYTGQVGGAVTVAAHGTIRCGAPLSLTATFVDGSGAPVAGQSVVWSFVTAPSSSDRINRTPTTTNSQGVATTTVTLGLVAGTRRIRATAGDVSASAVLNPTCGASLPNTSTLPGETTPGQAVPILAILLAIALFAGSGLTVRRLVSARR